MVCKYFRAGVEPDSDHELMVALNLREVKASMMLPFLGNQRIVMGCLRPALFFRGHSNDPTTAAIFTNMNSETIWRVLSDFILQSYPLRLTLSNHCFSNADNFFYNLELHESAFAICVNSMIIQDLFEAIQFNFSLSKNH